MDYKILDELFEKITETTGLTDIGYHEIKDGVLNPIYKTNTDVLGIERWKKGHHENPVHIKGTFVLEQIMETKKHIYIYNTKQDKRSSEAFFFFGVDSILIVPIVKENEVKGIICTVAIGKLHEFSEEEINKCVSLVKEYMM